MNWSCKEERLRFATSFSPFLIATALTAADLTDISGFPNISSRTQCDYGKWAISADFLAWYPSEDVSSIWADIFTIGIDTSSWTVPSFAFKWDYGFRLGAGTNFAYDEWDSIFTWTWFRTVAEHTIHFQSDTLLQPEFFAAFLSGNTPQSMNGKWSLLLNMFDWEIGRSYWIGQDVSLRPFLGIKGGWIDQSIFTHYFHLTIDEVLTQLDGFEHVKNNFWGIGPVGGINTTWRVRKFKSHFFDFFGDFSLASLWGEWTCSDLYKNTGHYHSSVNTPTDALGALMLRGFAGVGWSADFRNRSHFAAKLGFETQLWIDQLRIATFQLQRLHDDLSLQGITCSCRFDF